MNAHELDALIDDHLEGSLSEAGAARLSALLEQSREARQRYWEAATLHGLIESVLQQATVRAVTGASEPIVAKGRRWSWQPWAAAAAGIVLGMFCATVAWAVISPRAVATTATVSSLNDGSFEQRSGAIPGGFPTTLGAWTGDPAEIADLGPLGAKEGRRVLQFLSPAADDSAPAAPAISCDVFQLVDLRSLRGRGQLSGDSQLELNASFLDARRRDTQPSVTFFCQIYLFSGDPAAFKPLWPQIIPEALASGTAQVTTLGSTTREWQTLTAKCLLPVGADFAVVQLAARPNQRPAKMDGLFADDVRLTIRTSPELPTRILKH